LAKPAAFNRRDQLCDGPEYEPTVIQFVSQTAQSGQDGYLEIALLVASILPTTSPSESLIELLTMMVDRGFRSPQPLVRLAAFHFILHCKFFSTPEFFQRSAVYWDLIVDSLEDFVSQNFEVPRIVNLFNRAIREQLLTDLPVRLLSHCLSFCGQYRTCVALVHPIQTVIQSLCHVFPSQVVGNEHFEAVLRFYLELSGAMFDPADQYSVSQATLFESVFGDLAIGADVVGQMLSLIVPVRDTPLGLFLLVRTLGLTIRVSPDDGLAARLTTHAFLYNPHFLARELTWTVESIRTTFERLEFVCEEYPYDIKMLKMVDAPTYILCQHDIFDSGHVARSLMMITTRSKSMGVIEHHDLS
jgi:hypothetical protein